MKNIVYTVLGLSLLVMGMMAVSWAQNPPPVRPAPETTAPAGAPAAAAPASMTKEETIADLKTNLESVYAAKLPFKVTEDKILAFVRTAIKVEKINSKWDVQIAAAETDQMAIEYNNFAVEEVNEAMKSMEGVTFDEYQALTKLTVEDPDFNKIYQAYKQLVQEGYFGAVPAARKAVPTVSTPPAKPASPGKAPAPRG
jgi:hypothetical protein